MSDFSRFTASRLRVGTQSSAGGGDIVTISINTTPVGVRDIPFINTGLFLRPAEAAELADALRDAVAHVAPKAEVA